MATSTIPAEIYQDNTPMPFGMHKGKALGNIPAKYFLWLYDKGCDHAALKQYIISNMDCFQKEISRIPTRR